MVDSPQPEQYLTESLTKPIPPHLPQMAESVRWRLSVFVNNYLQVLERKIAI